MSKISPEDRKSILAERVDDYLAAGWKLELQRDYLAVVTTGRTVNHILHLLLSVMTVGLWLLPWLWMATSNRPQRLTISVDEFGNMTED